MAYPGRVIIIGLDREGERSIVVYAITGRSPSSQARILGFEGKSIWTKPTDEEALKKGDPYLLIYPAISLNRGISVSNGRQTADIEKQLATSRNPEEILRLALQGWSFESDSPIFTPRISGCVVEGGGAALSILKRAEDGSCQKGIYPFPSSPGKGRMICTYSGLNERFPSPFPGEPLEVEMRELSPEKMAASVYETLGSSGRGDDFRVGVACVYARINDLSDYALQIINRRKKME